MDLITILSRTFFDIPSMMDVLPQLLATGLVNTIIISVAATVLGTLFGLILALMGISPSRWLRVPARLYTDLFRGLPSILTILLIGQGLARFSYQLFGPTPYPLGIFALSLIASAYMGEIFRSGIQSVEQGQMEACRALGMSYGRAMRLVIIPQGIRRVLPAIVNQFIAIIKDSSLVYLLGLMTGQRELFRVGQDAAVLSGNLSPLMLAGLFYLAITVPLTHAVNYIDVRYRTGRRRATAPQSGLKELDEVQQKRNVVTTVSLTSEQGH
ncbi:amino acid ABC transporter permease [Klebsiella michiganensis]|uniref:amino acid ABC transporter permease n=1 Tax=Klebsiella michiganensis TaxID=1134687 RepID=UPI000A1CE3BD|nr:amino acid ABC transporter permease [Klebsiella michiganensis]AVE77333.1 amino acid ABC transporter permease [Klebsiella oxytoca]MBZ7332218.1 amino acid ABC transporter permease [Klebsiella michiganensis]MBZ7430093.1 amino acid ABC transporter permease [Klebsiella michiganensis]MDM4468918.1 amino acid ABC transporter permease [Klebsiella michiganensis]MDM4584054.1 amino acid ABC transporter permease [Klebsiella michiganensis]